MDIGDQCTRDRIRQDLDHNYMVEAGAGTGKTTLLVSRIIEIIRSGKASLPQIVAITFTEKAAAELKMRVEQQFSQQLDQQQISRAFSELDRACITTIHGFCANLLRDYPGEAGVNPSFQVADEAMKNMLYRHAWKKWLGSQIQADHPLLRELLILGISLQNLANMAQHMVQYRDVLRASSVETPHPISVADLRSFFDQTVQTLMTLADDCCNHEDLGYRQICNLHEEWQLLRATSDSAFEHRVLHGIFACDKRRGNQKYWKNAEKLREVKSIFASLNDEIARIRSQMLHNLTHRIISWLMHFIDFYRCEKENRAFLDFEDLLLSARDMLKNNRDVRQKLQHSFQYLLVDEFQDTDPLQVEIVFFLAEETPRADTWDKVQLKQGKLFLVGDPKQSIYRFRRADIEIYEEVKRKLDNCIAVTQNFRSRPGIIDWVNHVFSHLIQRPEDGYYQPDYIPIFPSRPSCDHEKSVIFLLNPTQAPNTDHSVEEIVAEEAHAIAFCIDFLIKEKWSIEDGQMRPVKFSDIAILLRRFSYVEAFEEAMQRFQIPYQVVGGKSYYRCLEVKSLLSLLRSIIEPYNKLSLVATLRSPIMAISDEDILTYQSRYQSLDYREIFEEQSHIGKVLKLLAYLHEMTDTTSTSLLLEEIFKRTGMLLTFGEMTQGVQRVANLLKFIEMAHTLRKIGVRDFRGFVQWVSEMEQSGEDEEESTLHEEGTNVVRIFSIHKAKGLEFPVVIMGDLAAMPRQLPDILLDRMQHSFAIRMRGRMEIQTENYEAQAENEKKRLQAEERRLMYVAMTRPRDYLIIPLVAWRHGYLELLQPLLPSMSPSGDTRHSVIHVLPKRHVPNIPWQSHQVDTYVSPDLSLVEAREKWLYKRREILTVASSCSAQTRITGEDEQTKIDKTVRYVLANLEVLAGDDLFLLHEITDLLDKQARVNRLSQEEHDLAYNMLSRAISSPLLNRAQQSNCMLRAFPFMLCEEGNLYRGIIDLCFQEKSGGLVVVFYKTENISASQIDEYLTRCAKEESRNFRAIQQITGCVVSEAFFFFLTSAKAYPCTT